MRRSAEFEGSDANGKRRELVWLVKPETFSQFSFLVTCCGSSCRCSAHRCTGEPTRKKRLKKGEVRPDDRSVQLRSRLQSLSSIANTDQRFAYSMLELEAQFKAFDIGGAMTFQFIERKSRFCVANRSALG